MPCLSCSRRAGFSLAEVVVSVLLVGTLLVAILAAHRRAAGQLQLAHKRLDATKALDALLEARERPDAGELLLSQGKAPGQNPYHWRSMLRFEPGLEEYGGAILRVELFEPQFHDDDSLVHVELVVPSGAISEATR